MNNEHVTPDELACLIIRHCGSGHDYMTEVRAKLLDQVAAMLRAQARSNEAQSAKIAELERCHRNGRRNIRDIDGGIEVCNGDHEKSEPCEWIAYRQHPPTEGPHCKTCSCMSAAWGAVPPRDFLARYEEWHGNPLRTEVETVTAHASFCSRCGGKDPTCYICGTNVTNLDDRRSTETTIHACDNAKPCDVLNGWLCRNRKVDNGPCLCTCHS